MVILILIVIGLCLGSFTNALVWRLREQAAAAHKHPDKAYRRRLSLLHGRSMCPRCKHELAARDLVPVFSWLALGGRCRYCHKPISRQYPVVELVTAAVFVASYLWWPTALHGSQIALLVLWLVLVPGLLALLIYDVRWGLLPSRLIYPLSGVALVFAILSVIIASHPLTALINLVLAVAIGGGVFYLLFQTSGGKWIGGGDVRLGWLLGLIAGTPGRSVLFIFLAAVGGTLLTLPLLAKGRLKRDSTVPFGPFLIVAIVVVQLFGAAILDWYQRTFITF